VAARLVGFAALALIASASGAWAQQDDPAAWSRTAARGAFDLCRADAPDAAAVVEHGEVWGWPRFTPYLEHPLGYKRLAGGESRRTFQAGGKSALVELTVQNGVVTSAAPANIAYFRCNLAADQAVGADLTAYFTGLYGAPSTVDGLTVWISGEPTPAPAAAASEDAALSAAQGAAVGARIIRVELSRERGLDRAKLTIFQKTP
jgi:hypothetical protein